MDPWTIIVWIVGIWIVFKIVESMICDPTPPTPPAQLRLWMVFGGLAALSGVLILLEKAGLIAP